MKQFFNKLVSWIKSKFTRVNWKLKYENQVKETEVWEFRYNKLARQIRELGDKVYNDNHMTR